MLGAMAGFDPKDSTSADRPLPDFEAVLGQGVTGMKIGIPKEYRLDGTDPEILALWDQGIEWLEEAGAETVEVSLPRTKYALPAYYIIAPAEASSNLSRYDGMRYGERVEGLDDAEYLLVLGRDGALGQPLALDGRDDDPLELGHEPLDQVLLGLDGLVEDARRSRTVCRRRGRGERRSQERLPAGHRIGGAALSGKGGVSRG